MGSFGAHGIEEGAGNLYVHFQMRLIFERVAKFRWVPLGDLCVNTAVTKAQVWVKMNYGIPAVCGTKFTQFGGMRGSLRR